MIIAKRQKIKSNQEWRYWGAADPLYAVAAWEGKNKSGNKPWTIPEFLELGRRDFADVQRHWDHYGRTGAGTCVEIGCGAGRMTAALVQAFDKVFAVDVSPDQIAMAAKLLGESASRVEFRVVDVPEIPLPDRTCVAMFSTHVFQHFSDFSAVVEYLRQTFRVLRPGGTICFHLPVPGAHGGEMPGRLATLRNRLRLMLLRTVLKRGAIMEYRRYPITTIFSTLRAIGYRDLELRIFPMSSNGDPHSFFFARK